MASRLLAEISLTTHRTLGMWTITFPGGQPGGTVIEHNVEGDSLNFVFQEGDDIPGDVTYDLSKIKVNQHPTSGEILLRSPSGNAEVGFSPE